MRNRHSFRPVPKSAQAGFSLIEIIIVVVLIGGIVAFAASRILGGGDKANVHLAKAQVQTLAEKVQQFQMDTGALPSTLEELVKAPGDAQGWLHVLSSKDGSLRNRVAVDTSAIHIAPVLVGNTVVVVSNKGVVAGLQVQ